MYETSLPLPSHSSDRCQRARFSGQTPSLSALRKNPRVSEISEAGDLQPDRNSLLFFLLPLEPGKLLLDTEKNIEPPLMEEEEEQQQKEEM